MSEAEQQLRAILKDREAGALDLLDEVLAQYDHDRLQAKADTKRAERSLSALRGAVVPFLAMAREEAASGLADYAETWRRGNTDAVNIGHCRALLAAYDGAQVAPTPCGKRSPPGYDNPGSPCTLPAGHRGRHEARDVSGKLLAASTEPAPTLTLEEVEACFRETLGPAQGSHLLDGFMRRAKERLAQKGAGRGDGK